MGKASSKPEQVGTRLLTRLHLCRNVIRLCICQWEKWSDLHLKMFLMNSMEIVGAAKIITIFVTGPISFRK